MRTILLFSLVFVLSAGCDKPSDQPAGNNSSGGGAAVSELRGKIEIQGSSTVEPISNQAKERFNAGFPHVKITVGRQGTGNGFSAFAKKETDISDASRPIKKSECDDCQANGVEFIEIPIAYDGLSIVVHPKNQFVKQLTLEQLKQIFRQDGVRKWNEVDPSWPDQPINIFAPGTGSGTFDYFLEVVGKEKIDGKSVEFALRSDEGVTLSEDDNLLVRGVSGDEFSIGYFGFAYYEANAEKLRVVPIINPDTGTAVLPSNETIESGEYAPFSRPLFLYVNRESLELKSEVAEFVEFYLTNVREIVAGARYVPLPDKIYQLARENVESLAIGTHFVDAEGNDRKGALETVFTPANLVQ